MTTSDPELGELRWLIGGSAVVVPVVTLSWVLHNLGIHRRRGPRRTVTPAILRYEADFNGRRIDADWALLAEAREVVIELDGQIKRYRVVDAPQAASQAPAEVAQEMNK